MSFNFESSKFEKNILQLYQKNQLHGMHGNTIHLSWHIIFYFYRIHLSNIKRSSSENKWQILLQTPFDPASVRFCWQITVAINNGINCRPFDASKLQLCSSREKNFNSDIIWISNLNVVHHHCCLWKLKARCSEQDKTFSFELRTTGINPTRHIHYIWLDFPNPWFLILAKYKNNF